MALVDPTYIGVMSAAISLGGAALTWRNARGARMHTGFELARSLYGSLTSPQMCNARDVLGFEGVLIGRESLLGQKRMNGTEPAVRYLDNAIRWHVQEWAKRWPELRQQIKDHVRDLDDHHSLTSFIGLTAAVLHDSPEVAELLELLADPQ
ncbi:hypothetical protein [Nocardia brasiliensis]|uniref:hypothetical protein n=1 Tax=Nocardia brasiliensis TaxID=37326 RepID=UPI0018958645|nr:hypothetical protein [Nocardia brasiliensis]MBF6543348.1 hypothetical protein [Nocardia brasiliensis]